MNKIHEIMKNKFPDNPLSDVPYFWIINNTTPKQRSFKTYSVDGILPNLHDIYEVDEIPVKNFSGNFIDLSMYEIIGYVAGAYIAKSPKLTFDVFRFVHIAGEYTHIKKLGKVTVVLAKQTEKGRVTTLICKRK